VSCHAGLNVRTTGLDRAELNGSCRDHLTGCRPGPSTARLVIQAGPGPLPIVSGCAHTEPNCAGPFTTGQIFRTTMTSRLRREERVVMLWHGLGRVERAMTLWFGRDDCDLEGMSKLWRLDLGFDAKCHGWRGGGDAVTEIGLQRTKIAFQFYFGSTASIS
jgi:hypothetical protein